MKQCKLINAWTICCIAAMMIISSCGNDDESLPGVQTQSQTLQTTQIAQGLTSPVTLAEAPDGSKRLFVVDQIGEIKIISPDKTMRTEPFLDLKSKLVSLIPGYDERGLLGFAFHPSFAITKKFYVFYSAPLDAGAPAGYNHTNIISEFKVSTTDSNKAEISSEKIMLKVNHPYFNNNGGGLAFGPDNFLYISIGDGGNSNDKGLGHVNDWYAFNAGGNGQDVTQNYLGNILRIDVDAGVLYGIPGDNPFVGKDGLDEIYAFGLRNPYRFSFDMAGNKALYLGDVGQALYEEIDIITKGGNYGWNVKEGTHCFNAADSIHPPSSCPSVDSAGNPLIDPVIELKSKNLTGGLGVMIIGGYVYRGTTISALNDRYIFGLFSSDKSIPDGRVFQASTLQSGLWNFQEITDIKLNQYILGFGQDLSGEVYVLGTTNAGPSGTTGKVYKIVKP